MTNHIFERFSEVEESIKINAPNIVYKYRADWTNPFHRQIITNQIVWFAAPRDLNDPNDIRIPLNFDENEIESPAFFSKLKAIFIAENQGKALTEKEIEYICENKLDEILINPIQYFKNNYEQLREDSIYDRVGVFSCTINELNKNMWDIYGNNNTGFIVGFKTAELESNLMCSIGQVKYSNEISKYSFLNTKHGEDFDCYFLKSKEWEYEQEFRFLTFGDNEYFERARKYSIESVAEVIIGSCFPTIYIDDFKKTVRHYFGDKIPIYQIKFDYSESELKKVIVF